MPSSTAPANTGGVGWEGVFGSPLEQLTASGSVGACLGTYMMQAARAKGGG